MASQTLGFRVSLVQSAAALHAACSVRSAAYGHHLPQLKEPFLKPDEIDMMAGTAILLAVDKLSGTPLGTARIQTTARGRSLPIEGSVDLPPAYAKYGRAEITRLSAVAGADTLVKICLWKAAYLYCFSNQVKWLLIGARSNSLARQYQRLGATDIYPDGRMVPLAYAGGIPHRVLALDVMGVERHWFHASHGLFDFFFETVHEDIQFSDSAVQGDRVDFQNLWSASGKLGGHAIPSVVHTTSNALSFSGADADAEVSAVSA